MKTIIALFVFFVGFSTYAQTDLNEYKYIIVPKKFDGFKNINQHQTSTLIKYLFTGKGFNTVYDDQLPDDLKLNRCLGLMVDLQDDSTMFTTKTTINLMDCNSAVVFSTMEGVSKEKQYKEAYGEAIRESMRSFNGLNYVYSGTSEKNETITVSFKNDIKKLDESKSDSVAQVALKKGEEVTEKSPEVIEKATETTQYYKSNAPVTSDIKKGETEKPAFKKLEIKKPNVKDIWYAQPTENGYQLVDSTPKIRMNLLKSSAENVFMAQTDAKNGMVYQKDSTWIFEYYENDQLIQEELNIKF
mgnify:CR=1 FL=1